MFGLSSAILAAWTLQVVSGQESIRAVSKNQSRHLFERIAGYVPNSGVTDHNALDLDQKYMEVALAQKSFDRAKKIYEEGGNSKSYAELTLSTNLTGAIEKGVVVEGTAIDDSTVTGKVYETAGINQPVVKVQYDISQNQESWVRCRVGALSEGRVDLGCFKDQGTVKIDGTEYTYNYLPLEANKNGRTLQDFSLQAEEKMKNCGDGCPIKDAEMFATYYGAWDYGDKWIQAAFAGTATGFTNGDADFSGYGNDGKIEVIKKGTVFLNVFMYVIREFQDAINDCKSDCDLATTCNDDPVHAWDEGVAFYTGSEEGLDGRGSGKFLHQLADKRCLNFKTCGINGDLAASTKSYVNHALLAEFYDGKQHLLDGQCTEAEVTLKKVIDLMYIPLIQGTLRYAYIVDKQNGTEKQKAEGAIFAASILPKIHHFDTAAAATVYENMKPGAQSTSFTAVKTALESVYTSAGIKCKYVGGLVDYDGAYYAGAEPCEFDKSDDDGTTSGSDDKSNDDGAKSGEDDKSNDDGAKSGEDDKSNDDGAKSGEDDKSNDDGAKSGEDDDSAAFLSSGVITTISAGIMIMWNAL